MVWEYKTILFEFSKDGLLSDRYVDDEEMENNLNQLGQQGWDLVNVSLLQDGLLAFLKRPANSAPPLLDSSPKEHLAPEPSVYVAASASPAVGQGMASSPKPPVHSPLRSGRSPRSPSHVEHLRERLGHREEPAQERLRPETPAQEDDRIGGIRIS
ncbi:MAG: DUF4177 domain-containing protein [Desulfobulbaceae bacterium]|nr:DUF4177 domain-containing protein [Desulfobulbaceae bacterium]